MAYNGLEEGDLFGIQRGKINTMFEEVFNTKLESGQVLVKDNTTVFTPTLDYHPCTKLYSDQMRNNWDIVFNPQSINSDVFDRANMTGTQEAETIIQNLNNRFVSDLMISNWNSKENSIGVKGTAFNKNFGTVQQSVSEGNHTHTKLDLGLGNVDNTSDIDKGISIIQQYAFDLKAPLSDTYTRIAIDTKIDEKRGLSNSYFGNEPNGNYSSFDVDGVLKAHGDARVYQRLSLISTGAELHPTQSPSWVFYKGGQTLSFSSSSSQTIFFRANLPYGWSQGTDLTPRLHCVHQSIETGTVIWDITYSWANIGDVFPNESTVQKSFTSNTEIDTHGQNDLTNISGTNKEVGSVLIGSLTRRGDIDTSTTDTLIIAADLIILIDSFGTKQ